MKVKLVGGPDHGKTIKVDGGDSLIIPVKYEHASWLGRIWCHSCRKYEDNYKTIFNRKYRRVFNEKAPGLVEYHYEGES